MRLLNERFDMGVAPMDWFGVCVVCSNMSCI